MKESNEPVSLEQSVRTLQIIVGSMVIGATGFLIVGLVVPQSTVDVQRASTTLTYMVVGFAPIALIGSFILASVITSSVPKNFIQDDASGEDSSKDDTSSDLTFTSSDTSRLAASLSTVTILRCAMIEGAALFAGLAHMIERQLPALAVAVVLIMILAAHIPTTSRAKSWIEDRLRAIEQARRAQGSVV